MPSPLLFFPMSKYQKLFKSCGMNVRVAPDVFIEHPRVMEVGDDVSFGRGFHMTGKARCCRIGSHVTFYNNTFIQGSPGRFVLDSHDEFIPGTYISLGEYETSFEEVGHHSHFAPNCDLYGCGGLSVGPYCNIAAHAVFATVGHHDEITSRPMALTGEKSGPITLEEDVWVAANVTITANTRIARGCVIGANAVVTRSTEPMGLYAGVPAKRIRDR